MLRRRNVQDKTDHDVLTGGWGGGGGVVDWLLNVPATFYCISGMDLLRQSYVLPHCKRSCRSNFLSHLIMCTLTQGKPDIALILQCLASSRVNTENPLSSPWYGSTRESRQQSLCPLLLRLLLYSQAGAVKCVQGRCVLNTPGTSTVCMPGKCTALARLYNG